MDRENDEQSSPTIEPAQYAFLNHSTSTLTNKLPPDVDNKPLARQKRKRTSPEDQAVLEAAYARDPKPDKEARLRLVEQIALGEKEVQIWFQNRRQTSRRKSRPLLPHEIAQFQLSRYGTSSADAGHIDELHESQLSDPASDSSQILSSDGPNDEQDSSQTSKDPASQGQAVVLAKVEQELTPSVQSSLPSLSQVLENLVKPKQSAPPPSKPLRKSASFVRLSMTSEGNVKVVTKDMLSPSPPRPESQETISASQPVEVSPSRRMASLKRSASGRSRDSRAWEFWCDKDSRNELEEKAEKDGRGSAADAIGLMRAASSRKALQPVAHKQNPAVGRQQYRSTQMTGRDPRRPSLQRAQTSEGRLQYSGDQHAKRKRLSKPVLEPISVHIPGNESDKENWSPGGNSKESRHRLNGKVSEKGVPDADPEISAFMSGGRPSRRLPADEELSCVQGLLSLSQGNWAC